MKRFLQRRAHRIAEASWRWWRRTRSRVLPLLGSGSGCLVQRPSDIFVFSRCTDAAESGGWDRRVPQPSTLNLESHTAVAFWSQWRARLFCDKPRLITEAVACLGVSTTGECCGCKRFGSTSTFCTAYQPYCSLLRNSFICILLYPFLLIIVFLLHVYRDYNPKPMPSP